MQIYIEMYWKHSKGRSVVAEKFIRAFKSKIYYKYMTSVSKIKYIDKLANIFHKYINTYQVTIKMKPVDVKSSTYIDFNKEYNQEDLNFRVCNKVIVLFLKHNFPWKSVNSIGY